MLQPINPSTTEQGLPVGRAIERLRPDLSTVVEGCGNFNIGGELREVGQKNVVYVPAGVEHSVKNDSGDNLTLLVMMTPNPNYPK